VHVTVTGPSQVSSADARNVTAAPSGLVQCALIVAGNWSTGAAVSLLTVTVKDAVAKLPEPSRTWQRTVVTPIGKTEPEAGAQIGIRFESQLSVAVTENRTTCPEGGEHGISIADGTLKMGGCVSRTVTVKEHSAELRRLSKATHLTVVTPSGKVLPDGGVD